MSARLDHQKCIRCQVIVASKDWWQYFRMLASRFGATKKVYGDDAYEGKRGQYAKLWSAKFSDPAHKVVRLSFALTKRTK